ncbi:hypothetical protein [Streptomyces xanthophaeus]|uniref:hypothetical protein n=1 Tax=Streptomyces xanthophaeus TaxID=67385 RepID=UPI0026499977|nr:hypothetical protein [Streptomyces xanthophaeus]WKD31175.1 hypothetical protein KO717_03825 [Streptomyces xanthophaeus]
MDLETEANPPYFGRQLTLTARVMGHPSCTASLRDKTLRMCSPEQLALLGSPRADDLLAAAIADVVRARIGTPPPMTPQLIDAPTAAQVLFRQGPLHDLVFESARDMLPTAPDPDASASGDAKDWLERHKQAHEAWGNMWRQILERQPDRHRDFVEGAAGTDSEHPIHEQLLGRLPWAVEPELLAELAAADLDRLSFQILLAQGSRMRRDGSDEQQILQHYEAELSACTDEEQREFRFHLERESTTLLDFGCRAPVSWVRRAASGTWRHVLNPTQAKDGYRQAEWLSPAKTLAELAANFAEAAMRALPYWEPDNRYTAAQPDDVTWLRDMLLHLPTVTAEVKAAVRPIVRHVRGRLSNHHHGLQPRYDHRRRIEDLLDTIERVLADPPPAIGADRRRAALGSPENVSVRELASASAQVLCDYLDRHVGDDSLVEKALLASVAGTYRSADDLEDVLRRHSSPDEALLRVTLGLRRNLGGAPSWRETWTSMILTRPDTGPELVRALPAWSALRARGSGPGSAHPLVVSVVCEALGSDQGAWERFANGPATYSGPTAWLRLGDVLDAAATGATWPKPPAGS